MRDPLPPVAAAQAMATVRAVRLALLALHKRLIDTERERFEQSRGRIEGPHEALRLLMTDPFFAWFKPVGHLIVECDGWLADERFRQATDATRLLARVRALLSGDAGDPFATEYRRALQDSTDVVVAHARVAAILAAGR